MRKFINNDKIFTVALFFNQRNLREKNRLKVIVVIESGIEENFIKKQRY